MKKTVVTMKNSGPDWSASFEARSRSGVLAILNIYKNPSRSQWWLQPLLVVLTDITHSRVGPWDLCLSFRLRGWPKPCPANSCIHTVSTELQRINSKPKKYLNWRILHTINKLFSICTSTCVHIQHVFACWWSAQVFVRPPQGWFLV
jgi:hypothetical protein